MAVFDISAEKREGYPMWDATVPAFPRARKRTEGSRAAAVQNAKSEVLEQLSRMALRGEPLPPEVESLFSVRAGK